MQELEPQLAEGGELHGLQDWAGKLSGAVLRLAGLLHIADAASVVSDMGQVTNSQMEKAIRLGEYLLDHAKIAFDHMGADADLEQARRILKVITNRGKHTISRRDIYQALKGTYPTVASLQPGLDILMDHEHIRQQDPVAGSNGGRPSPAFEVNPNTERDPQNPQNGGF